MLRFNAQRIQILPVAQPRSLAVLRTPRSVNADWERDAWLLPEKEDEPGFLQMRVAADRLTRERAYKLAMRLYRRSGFVPSAGTPANASLRAFRGLVCEYDARPDTLTLLLEDARGHAAGTMTMVCDLGMGLPCDEIFRKEMDSLRARGRRLVEATRLALSDEQLFSETVFLRLINFLFVYAVRVRRATDLVIEVNPRHVNYYRRMLGFEPVGEPCPCPRVNGAPAVLLVLETGRYCQALAQAAEGGSNLESSAKTPSLYRRFFPREREAAIAAFLQRMHRSMTEEDLRYFGLSSHAHSHSHSQVLRATSV